MNTELEIYKKFFEAIKNKPKELISNYSKIIYYREQIKKTESELNKLKNDSTNI